jgi:tetratricopeptide (TPR) repeat protein
MAGKPRDTLIDTGERGAVSRPSPRRDRAVDTQQTPRHDASEDTIITNGNAEIDSCVQRCLTNPDDPAAWDALEALSVAGPETQLVRDLYKTTLDRELPSPLLLELASRAVRFHDEWSPGDDSLLPLLLRVLDIDPTVKWAFDRISLELTMRARGVELLGLYDRVLTAVASGPRYMALLAEAADIARESAGRLDRAIGYLDRLFSLDPKREAVASALERLLAQAHRHQDLIVLWKRRTEIASPREAALLRVRAAEFCLTTMGDAALALATLDPFEKEPLVTGEAREPDAVWMLYEQILASPLSGGATWREALSRLRHRAEGLGKQTALVAPLRVALGRADVHEVPSIHAEIAKRLVDARRSDEAVADLAAVIALDPVACNEAVIDALLAETDGAEILGCRPLIDLSGRRELVRVAAQQAAARRGGEERAIALYVRLLRDLPDDAQIIGALDELYRAPERHSALIQLRRHELALATEVGRRQALRLDVARLHLLLGQREEATLALRENLVEEPTSQAAADAVTALLEAHQEFEALCEIAEEHAAASERAAKDIAVELWARAAEVAERRLFDVRRSMRDHERVVALSGGPGSLDALGRMHCDLGEHRQAIHWLKQLVASARPAEHASDVLRLATSYVTVGETRDALLVTQAGLLAEPKDLRLHMMHVELQRGTSHPEDLVAALVAAAPCADAVLQRALLREAAEVLGHELLAPSRAVPLLERVVSLPCAVTIDRIDLAETLYRAGRSDEARRIGTAVLNEFGRRHPPERARVHLLLGRIAVDRGEREVALGELESSIATEVGNPLAQLLLGKVSRALGLLDRAERAFHALLLLQRRGDVSDAQDLPMSETLVELYLLANERGKPERAAENLAAAFDAAAQSEVEARGLERALREAELLPLLLKAEESHLTRAPDDETRVALLYEMSTVLGTLERHDEAVDAALRALALAPEEDRLHERAKTAVGLANQLTRYARSLEPLIASALERGDGKLGAALLLRLGETYETDLDRPDLAEAAYSRAEDTGEMLALVWRKRARLAARGGHHDARLHALRKLADSQAEMTSGEWVDTLYAVAELELQREETVPLGLASLQSALLADPRPREVAESLRRALTVAADTEPIAQLFEAVARQHGDDAMLLEALCLLTAEKSATQGLVAEAVSVASRLPESDETDAKKLELLDRSVALARAHGDQGEALWAMKMLVDEHERHGDRKAALSWARAAADVAEPEESAQLRRRATALAVELGDVDAALDCYERLVGSDPGDSEAWSAMLALLRKTRDVPRLDRALARAAEESRDPHERAQLRMERARLQIAKGDRAAARDALRAMLDEEPDQQEAVELFSSLLDPNRDRDELMALLTRRIDVLREARDATSATPLVLRLAELKDEREALDVVRDAIAWIPDSPPLLRRLVDLLETFGDPTERADAIERLVEHEEGQAEVDRAVQLVRARMAAGLSQPVERAILRLAAIDPGHPETRTALAWLAAAKIGEASERPDEGVALLRAAAEIQHQLGDLTGALETLERAYALSPGDPDLIALRARRLLDAGRGREGVALLLLELPRVQEGRARGYLLAVLASLHSALLEHDAAVLDLERACGGDDGERWLPDLLKALGRARAAAEARKGEEARPLALREATVLEKLGRQPDARALLATLAGDDAHVLRRMLDLDAGLERWDLVIQDCQRLLLVVESGELADVALRLADACEWEGRAEDARDGLEFAYESDPSNLALFERLRDLYLRAGAYRELANRLFTEAQRTADSDLRFERLLEVGRLRVERLGESATAVGPLSDALALQPGHQEATLLLADAFAAAGLTDDATTLLATAMATHGARRTRALAELQQRMARVVAKQSKAEGMRWLVLALESHPKSADIAKELAEVATELGDLEVAARALRVLTSKELEADVRARAYLGQAEIALLQSNKARALALARKAVSEEPELSAAHDLLRRLGAGPQNLG